jgi:PAS domain S-box-containing protein
MLDPTGIIISWNAGAQRIKGYQADEIIGEHFSRFYLPEDRAAGIPARGLEVAARVGRFEKEGWRVRKDGTSFWANVVIDAIRDENGKLLGFAKVTRDMTERVEAQKALDQAREALFQAQKMEALGQLTGGVAHDFNNLLSVVLGGLELLRKRLPEDAGVFRLLDNAYQAAERAAGLTQRMLAFARRQELQVTSVELPTLIHGMHDLLAQAIDPSIAVEARLPLVLPAVRTDANQLEAAILNLIVNARDAMPNGGIITISAKEHMLEAVGPMRAGRYVCLAVSDTGSGMDERTLSRALEPFFTTKGIGKGTGLGLPMVHGLAVQSGGHFAMKSRLGEGTTAELWLPVATETEVTEEEPVAATPQAAVAGHKRLRILAVDDDELVLSSMVAMLEDMRHDVTPVRSAAAALKAIEDIDGFDIVITDHAMPEMTGAQLIDIIRERWPFLPVVLSSGFAELDTIARHPVRLAKPFRQSDLLAAIVHALDPIA